MRTGTTLTVLAAVGFAAAGATAQDIEAVGGGNGAQRSPTTTPNDVPAVGRRVAIPAEAGAAIPGQQVGRGSVGTAAPGRQIGDEAIPGRRTGLTVPAGTTLGGAARGVPVEAGIGPVAGFNDALFAAAAAASGVFEVASSRIAAERGGSDEVKLFAQKMIADHTKANHELMALAASKALAVPAAPDPCALAKQNILASSSGEGLDHCYVKQQMAAHLDAVGLFEAEAERGRDPELRAWAARMVPVLKEHLRHVKRMHQEMEAKLTDQTAAPH